MFLSRRDPDEKTHVMDLVGVETAGGLVHDEDIGLVEQYLRHAHSLPVAFRELEDALFGYAFQVALSNDGVDSPAKPRVRKPARTAKERE